MGANKPHTPTPWHTYERNPCAIGAGPKESPLHLLSIMRQAGATEEQDAQQDANAAFIVRACNSHDALVAALKTIACEHYESAQYARDVARAALAKAGAA